MVKYDLSEPRSFFFPDETSMSARVYHPATNLMPASPPNSPIGLVPAFPPHSTWGRQTSTNGKYS